MEFIWDMTEENWNNLMHDINTKYFDELSDDYDFYGQMYIGDYCIEFITTDVGIDEFGRDKFMSFTNIYQLFVDDGYGEDKNGNPYTLTDLYIDVPETDTFEEFKNLCERRFTAGISTSFSEKFADKKCEWGM
jgi:hypothetical protein